MHEALCHSQSHYVTLTHAPGTLSTWTDPANGKKYVDSLNPNDIKLFFQRLRDDGKRFQYFMCGEYGAQCAYCGHNKRDHKAGHHCHTWEKTHGRPHYHMILFGLHLDDLVHKTWRNGNEVYESDYLTQKWGKGFVDIGKVTFNSASYVAKYIHKKKAVHSDDKELHFSRRVRDSKTNDYIKADWVYPEYTRCSKGNRLSPENGIGYKYLKRFISDIFPHDRVVLHRPGKPPIIKRPPRYYLKLLEKWNPEMYKQVKSQRIAKAMDITLNDIEERQERLKDKEAGRLKHVMEHKELYDY